ncbi:hypothetical protein BC827DRAFT_1167669 [Russula dissimulans]|nr:hypothetical protein BC827DRAFT_1167669 [Russula dissimulans]
MATQLNRKLTVTFLFSLAVLLVLTAPSSANLVSPDAVHRRDHVNLNRMIKIRAVAPGVARQLDPAVNAGDKAAADSASPTTPSTTSDAPTSQDAQRSSSPPSSPQSSSTTSSAQDTESVSSTSKPSSPSSTSSAVSTSTTTSSTSTTPTPSTSSTPTPKDESTPLTPVKGKSTTVDSVTVTSHVPAASSSSGSDSAQLGASSLSHTTITILIVLASSIGGCAIIWTIIRKWKFRPSSQFEDRLEPVNWQPTEHDSGFPTHRRMPSNASSFHSAGHDNMGLSRGDSIGAYNANRGISPLPDHDFTAGAPTLAPVGGYADLARGPSPQPQMQETLQRGPSVNRGYETYLGPPPHYPGGYGAQDAYDYDNAGPRY